MADDMNVTFLLMPDRVTHGISLSPSSTVLSVKKKLSRATSFDSMDLSFNGSTLRDEMTLEECGVRANFPDNQIVIEARSRNRKDRDTYSMPKSFDVVIYPDAGDEMPRKIKVEVESKQDKKSYLGGFKHSKSGAIYHHAATQTAKDMKKKWENMPERFHRETQTRDRKSRSTQSARETGTQMKRTDISIDDTNDKVIKAGSYFTSKMLDALRLEKTIVMQCYWRQYKARCAAWAKREAIVKRKRDLEEARQAERTRLEARHRADIERRLHPRSSKDFEILYNDLHDWHEQEADRIRKETKSPDEKRKDMTKLLKEELKLLQSIDRLKIEAQKHKKQKRVDKMLDLMSAPKKWEMRSGQLTAVHTPYTTRAEELRSLYQGLGEKLCLRDRLDVLLHVKWTVKEFDCNLTRDIVDLVDREADLLRRSRPESSLVGLRRRLRDTFLRFIETPEFNPEASRFQKVPQDIESVPALRPIPH